MGSGLVRQLFEARIGEEKSADDETVVDRLVSEDRLTSLSLRFARHLLGSDWSEERALFLAYLLKSAQEGHLCVEVAGSPKPDPMQGWLAGFDQAQAVLAAIQRGAIAGRGVRQVEQRFYLERLYTAEERVRSEFGRLVEQPPEKTVEVGTPSEQLLPEQRQAIESAAKHTLSMIVGGPGTGKTFTAAHLIDCVGKGQRVALAAPTGKAAGNLQRALVGAMPVRTLHALLGLPRRPVGQLSADLIVVDEASMIDVNLMGHLLSAVKPGARLVLMGDSAQLPPVEAGGLFGGFVEHPQLQGQVTRLVHCVRTDKRELIDLAGVVRQGDLDGTLQLVKRIPWNEKEVVEQVVRASREGWRILTALRRGPFGAETLNQRVVEARCEAERPIVITRNDYRLELFNGDEGVLVGDTAHIGGRAFSRFALPTYEYAYCLSVHKSQGSEFGKVLLVAPPGSEGFGRELLYTALTRAKEQFAICSPDSVLAAMLIQHAHRHSGVSSFAFKGRLTAG